jgi:hypothetical protein
MHHVVGELESFPDFVFQGLFSSLVLRPCSWKGLGMDGNRRAETGQTVDCSWVTLVQPDLDLGCGSLVCPPPGGHKGLDCCPLGKILLQSPGWHMQPSSGVSRIELPLGCPSHLGVAEPWRRMGTHLSRHSVGVSSIHGATTGQSSAVL